MGEVTLFAGIDLNGPTPVGALMLVPVKMYMQTKTPLTTTSAIKTTKTTV